MGSPYALRYSRAFDRDLDAVPAYDAVVVRTRIAVLAHVWVLRLTFKGRKTTEEMGR